MELLTITKSEARSLIEEIKAGISATGERLLELYEREGWRVLGYSNWRECVMAELDFRQTHVYRLLNFATVEQNLSPIGEKYPLPQTEGQARPLTKLSPQLQREVWPIAVETAPNGKVTAKHVEQTVKEFNYKRDNKANREGGIYTPKGYDACQTPPEALDPLLPYIPETFKTVWEPAQGEGLLVEALYDSSFDVIGSDILDGRNFFEWQPDQDWDCIITNPPYSIKYEWLKRCYELGKPFALLMPTEMLSTKTAGVLFIEYGIELVVMTRRVNFKMPNKGWEGKGSQFPTMWFTYGFNMGKEINIIVN